MIHETEGTLSALIQNQNHSGFTTWRTGSSSSTKLLFAKLHHGFRDSQRVFLIIISFFPLQLFEKHQVSSRVTKAWDILDSRSFKSDCFSHSFETEETPTGLVINLEKEVHVTLLVSRVSCIQSFMSQSSLPCIPKWYFSFLTPTPTAKRKAKAKLLVIQCN
jgi:hypothetical protein